MNPNTAFSASLLLSLLLWLPSMLSALRGELDMPAAGLRYLAALTLCRFAIGGLARLLSAYRSIPVAAPSPAESPAKPEAPRRRKEDREEADAA